MTALAQVNTAVTEQQDNLPGIPDEKPTMLDIIARAARDPATDVDKLERLMAMAREERAAEAKRQFGTAMMAAQDEMGHVRADANNPQTKSAYATYAAIDRKIRPIYTKHGFALTFDTGDGAAPDHVRVLCEVFHEAGHTRTYHFDMPADGKGAKGGDVMTRTHAAGSAMSYGQRYLLKAIFNIVVGDDDGNATGGNGCITQEQIEKLRDVMARTNSDPEKVCKHFKLASLAEITQQQLPRIIEALNSQPGKKS